MKVISVIFVLLILISCKKETTVKTKIPEVDSKPIIKIDSILLVNSFSLKVKINIEEIDKSNIVEKGLEISEYNFFPNPTIKVKDSTNYNNFILEYNKLTENKTYYIRAYYVNNNGNVISQFLKIVTPEYKVSDIQNNEYHTIKINGKYWFSENLKTSQYSDGEKLTQFNLNQTSDWVKSKIPSCVVTNTIWGTYYNWHTVNHKNLCPNGWHVPTDKEYQELIDYLGGNLVAGYSMKSSNGNYFFGNGTISSGSNSSGFNGIPSGEFYDNGIVSIGQGCLWWTTSELNGQGRFLLVGGTKEADIREAEKERGFSVRCKQN